VVLGELKNEIVAGEILSLERRHYSYMAQVVYIIASRIAAAGLNDDQTDVAALGMPG
jgi:hypothetical protein